MNINEASQVTAISKDMIRYYEKIGLIKPVRKTNGYRDFSEDDLNTLVVIRTLSNSHIPLKQIRTAFQTDSVNSLLAGLSAELESIHKIQRQIKAREQAVQFEIDHMQQYAELRNPVLCHYPERWIVHPASISLSVRTVSVLWNPAIIFNMLLAMMWIFCNIQLTQSFKSRAFSSITNFPVQHTFLHKTVFDSLPHMKQVEC